MINATLYAGAGHPNVISWFATAIWSINERLANREGADLEELGGEWVNDVIQALSRRVRVQKRIAYDGPIDDGADADENYAPRSDGQPVEGWKAV